MLFETTGRPAMPRPLVFEDLTEKAAPLETLPTQPKAPALDEAREELEAKLRDNAELERRLAAAREDGREEMRQESEQRLRETLEIERTALAHLCAGFARTRERYFGEIEREVVKLALAVAAQILQRESAMDPTLLAGVVRVALANLGDANGAVLRVPEAQAEMWRRAMKSTELKVETEAAMEAGDVRLEAAGGVAELGVKAQLVEIERGFFDLLSRRPA